MKYYFNILIFSLFANNLCAQEFELDLVFEDAAGAKDTLTIGYDPTATNGIDASFGETNIISQSWGSAFEVRLSEHMWECDQYYTSNFTYHAEKQIKTKECNPAADLVWSVHLKNAVYPVQVS